MGVVDHPLNGYGRVATVLQDRLSRLAMKPYVGKANKFGGRVKKGKKHQGIDEGWDWFMFFELHPDFVELYALEHLEDFAIRLFALLLENNYKIKPLKKKPKLVNKAPLKKK